MRIYVSIFLFVCIINSILAQKTPDFATTFHFEDARGNRDSITIGYDSEKVPRMLDTAYGEYPIPQEEIRFDSIFEVRIRRGSDYTKTYFKSSPSCGKYAISENSNLLETFALFEINIRIRYPPLKVSWERDDFSDYCRKGSFIQGHMLGPLQGEYSDVTHFIEQDSVIYSDEEMLWHSTFHRFNYGDTVRVMNVQFYTGTSAVEEILHNGTFSIHPNPVLADFTISFQNWRPRLLSIYSQSGVLVKEMEIPAAGEQVEASLRGYPAGTYFCVLRDREGRSRVKKLVKG